MLLEEFPFEPGFRLTDGDLLNKVAAEPAYSVDNTVTATGSSQNTAYDIRATVTVVTAGGDNAGVQLPFPKVGRLIFVLNYTATGKRIYPYDQELINGAHTADLPFDMGMMLICTSNGTWAATLVETNTTGDIVLVASDADTSTGNGHFVQISGGAGGTTSGEGGDVSISGGPGQADGGDVTITGGAPNGVVTLTSQVPVEVGPHGLHVTSQDPDTTIKLSSVASTVSWCTIVFDTKWTSNPGQAAALIAQRNGVTNWNMLLGTSSDQFDFNLNRQNKTTGAIIDTPLTITHETGAITIGSAVAGTSTTVLSPNTFFTGGPVTVNHTLNFTAGGNAILQTLGAGDTLTIQTANSPATTKAGYIYIVGGNSQGAGKAGGVSIGGGLSSGDAPGGISIFAGTSSSPTKVGGETDISGGDNYGGGSAGDLYLYAGSALVGGAGGNIHIYGGSGVPTGIVSVDGPAKFTDKVGFNNTAPIAKPTVSGSKGGNAALASLLTALTAYGLVVDTTTA